jgi:PAS domain S-box-containing protein
MKLVPKLFLILSVVAAITVIITDVYIYLTISGTLEKNISEKQLVISHELIDRIDYFLLERMHDLRDLARDTDSVLALSDVKFQEPDLHEHIISNHFNPLLKNQIGVMDSLTIADPEGNIVVSSDRHGVSRIQASPGYQSLFRQALAGKPAYSDVYLDDFTQKPTLTIADPVFSDATGSARVIGVIFGNIDWANIIGILSKITDSTVYLYNSKSDLIASNSPSHNLLILKENHAASEVLIRALDHPKEGSLTSLDHEMNDAISTYVGESGSGSFPGNGWILVIDTPANVALAKTNQVAIRVTLFSTGTFILAMLLIGYFGNRSITGPISKMALSVRDIAEGKFDTKLPVRGKDEISLLSASINAMSGKLSRLYSHLEDEISLKTKALTEKMDFIENQNKDLASAKIDLSKFKIAVEEAPIHIIITDPKGVIIYANKASQKTTGFGVYEMIGQKPSLWGNQMDKSFYQSMWETLINRREIYRGTITNKRRNGQLYSAEVQISPVTGPTGDILFFVGIEADITAKQKIDRMKSEFISLTAHQLRTPLTAVKWLLEMYMSDYAPVLSGEQRESLAKIFKSNERMISLVSALLNVSRIESGRLEIKPEPTDIRLLVLEVVDEVKIRYQKLEHIYDIRIPENIPVLNIDAKMIRNVFLNLLTNASKYSAPKTGISVSLWIEGNMLVNEVRDNGYGIPSHEQEHIFDRFFRADNILSLDSDGTGLGLYLAKSIIDATGGKIWFESSEGVGSTFRFTIPLTGMTARKGEVRID